MKRSARVGVAGATGAVGLEMLRVLEERSFPVEKLTAMASGRGGDRTVGFGGADLPVVPLTEESLADVDIVLFATGASVSREFVPVATAAGAVAIDNSRVFRMDPNVPLIVPEVNPQAMAGHGGVIANPNCSTIQIVLPLEVVRREAGLVRVVASTYQSVSGTGLAAIEELADQSRAVLDGEPAVSGVYPTQIAFNCLPHIDEFDEGGDTREETKMIEETRKILDAPGLPVAVTCVRVPVVASHSEAVHIEFSAPMSPEEARNILVNAPGVKVLDDPSISLYPHPWSVAGTDEVFVGRIRRDASHPNGLVIWVVADNLRKGAALNTVQIAEQLISKGWL